MKTTLLLLFLLTIFSFQSRASHEIGGSIEYECLGNDQYLITLNIVMDCVNPVTSGPINIYADNDCGISSAVYSLSPTINQMVIENNMCDSIDSLSYCVGGTLPGINYYQWQGIATLPPCDSWTLSYSSCCLSGSTNLSGTSGNIYYETVLNSATDNCNSSPVQHFLTLPQFCSGQDSEYSFMVLDPDGDSLVYSLVDVWIANSSSAPYLGGFSGANPFPGCNLDSHTGLFTFSSSVVGSYFVAIRVDEYDNGVLVGTQRIQTLFNIGSCLSNNLPEDIGGIQQLIGGVQTGPYSAYKCGGGPLCFELYYEDANSADSIELMVVDPLIGSLSYTISGPNSDTIQLCLQTPANYVGVIEFYVRASDNICPVNQASYDHFFVYTTGNGFVGSDQVICLGDSVELNALYGDTVQWTMLSGDPITGSNFQCDTCVSSYASPTVTTTYMVHATGGGCGAMNDTITVEVMNPIVLTLQDSLIGCDTLQVSPIITSLDSVNYHWSNSSGFASTDTSVFNYELPLGGSWLMLSLENGGCFVEDSIYVANTLYNTSIQASATLLCTPDSVQLHSGVIGGSLGQGIIPSGVTDGSNSLTTWPAPYGNWYKNAKHQFIYRAQELTNMGMIPGLIGSIGWKVIQLNGTSDYYNYSIKVKMVTEDSLSNWVSGATQVFGPQDISITSGVNMHQLDSPILWDGTSNLMVEICYDNLAFPYTNNSETPWETTAYSSTLAYYSDGTPACSHTASYTLLNNRPITYFDVQTTFASYYNWGIEWDAYPSVSNHNIENPTTFIDTSNWYFVTITDTIGGCTWRDSIYIDYDDSFSLEVVASDTIACQNDTISLSAFINGSLGGNNHTYLWSSNGIMSSGSSTAMHQVYAPGYVLLELESTSGCLAKDSVFIDRYDYTPTIFTSNNPICPGDSVIVQAYLGGDNPDDVTYLWLGDSTVITHYNDSIVHAYLDSSALFTVLMTDTIYGCSSLSQITVHTFPEPSWASIVGEYIVDPYSTETYYLVGGNGFNADWSVTGGVITSSSTDSAVVDWGSSRIGEIEVILSDSAGCVHDTVITMEIIIGGVGTDDLVIDEFSVYPNPTNGEITIITQKVGEELELFDVGGRLLLRIKLNDVQNQLNLSQLARGTYYLKGRSNTIKLLID